MTLYVNIELLSTSNSCHNGRVPTPLFGPTIKLDQLQGSSGHSIQFYHHRQQRAAASVTFHHDIAWRHQVTFHLQDSIP